MRLSVLVNKDITDYMFKHSHIALQKWSAAYHYTLCNFVSFSRQEKLEHILLKTNQVAPS